MGSLELLSHFWSLNTILVVQLENFDFGGLSHPPILEYISKQDSLIYQIRQIIRIQDLALHRIKFLVSTQFDIKHFWMNLNVFP